MRNIIDKVTLIESENYNPVTIISHLKKSVYYDYEILVKVNVNFVFDDGYSYFGDIDLDAEISFDFLETKYGNIEWAHQGSSDYIAFYPDFPNNMRDWEYQVVSEDADHFLPSIKEKLKTMGFSDRAIKNLSVTFLNGDFLLTGCRSILDEVINSYSWYREIVGDIE